MQLASGHVSEPLEGEELARHQRAFKGYTGGLVRLTPGGWLFPADYNRFADRLYKFQIRHDDVLVMTYPKCGTTWMQELVWTLRNNPDLNHPDQDKPINVRVPFMDCDMYMRSSLLPPPDPTSVMSKEFARLCPGKDPSKGFFLQMAEAQTIPRTIKTHLPFSLLPPSLNTCKVVYVARQPKDVVVSYYHHSRLFKSVSYVGSFDNFIDFFLEDDLVYGSYGRHVAEAWNKRHDYNFHFVFYEDLKSDTANELKKLDSFLGTYRRDDQLENVKMHTSFEKMRERDNVFKAPHETDVFAHPSVLQEDGGFYRAGNEGNKYKLRPDHHRRLDVWIDANFRHLGIQFKNSYSPYL